VSELFKRLIGALRSIIGDRRESTRGNGVSKKIPGVALVLTCEGKGDPRGTGRLLHLLELLKAWPKVFKSACNGEDVREIPFKAQGENL